MTEEQKEQAKKTPPDRGGETKGRRIEELADSRATLVRGEKYE